ncbi:MAG: DUF2232 domain-containing protein [Actinobacteria bacterium]|nr:DUF2232 domain-containing protein [Actinomycetota bacterium]
MLSDQPTNPGLTDKMPVSSSYTARPLTLYVFACVLGSVAVPLFAFVGVFLTAYGAAVLMSKKKTLLAFVSVAVGSLGWFVYDPATGVYALLLSLITVFFARLIPKRFGQGTWFAGLLSMTASLLALDAVTALLEGTTIWGKMAAVSSEVMRMITAAGTIPAESVLAMKNAVDTVSMLWPAFYFIQAMLYMVILTVAARIAYRRHYEGFAPSGLAEVDMTIHIVWPLILGLLCVAASYLSFEYAEYAQLAGYNLLACSVALFLIQGLAVIAYLMEKAKLSMVVKVIVIVLALQMELMFFAPSIIGIMDFWVNFRKLPREAPSEPLPSS